MAAVTCCTVGELICYLVYFHHVFREINGSITRLLNPRVTRARNRKNIISFLGQFYGFLTEFAFWVTALIVRQQASPTTQLFVVGLKFMDFGVLSMVEVLVSNALWQMMLADIETTRYLLTWISHI